MRHGSIFKSTDQKIEELLDSAVDNKIHLGKNTHISVTKALIFFIIGILLVIGIWWLVAEIYNTYFIVTMSFPTPFEVFSQLIDYLGGKTLFRATIYEHISASLSRWIKGFLLGALIGIIIGFIISLKDSLYQIGIVPINILQMIPGLAWLPVAILLFGFGENSAIFMVGVVAISPLAISVSSGLRRVPQVNKRVAKMSGLSRLDTLTDVLLPFATLDILSGLRISIGSSWRMIIAAEMVVGVAVGLGFCISSTSASLNYVASFVCIVIICIIGLIIDKLVLQSVEKYTRRKMGFQEDF